MWPKVRRKLPSSRQKQKSRPPFLGLTLSLKEAAIREAEGQAEAIRQVQEATAAGIRMINEAAPGEGVIAIKSLEAFAKAADGKATKIIIPSEIQSLAGLVTSAAELAKKDE